MIRLKGFTYSNYRVTYDYEVSKSYEQYFKEAFYIDYREDINNIPESIINIPIIANLTFICWFLDINLSVNTIDEIFYDSLLLIQVELRKMYPNITSRNIISAENIVTNHTSNRKSMLLFTGGVDAYATYFRVKNKKPILVKVFGDKMNLGNVESAIKNEIELNKYSEELNELNIKYIYSNIRTFYSQKLNKLVKEGGWWSHVQHGYGLTTLLAPIGYKFKAGSFYIASSYTADIDIRWGSTPAIDNKLKWSGTQVLHDGYELLRQDKVDLIALRTKESGNKLQLRVCYSELNKDINCSQCEKCYRTILALMLNNVDPNQYGFKADETVYRNIIKYLKGGFKDTGVRYFWREIYRKIESGQYELMIFKDENNEKRLLYLTLTEMKLQLASDIRKKSTVENFKMFLVKAFPNLHQFYLKKRIKYLRKKI